MPYACKISINTKNVYAACALGIDLYLNDLGLETCGMYNHICGRKFVYFWADLLFLPWQPKTAFRLPDINKYLTQRQYNVDEIVFG
jgi:hypothetical protein